MQEDHIVNLLRSFLFDDPAEDRNDRLYDIRAFGWVLRGQSYRWGKKRAKCTRTSNKSSIIMDHRYSKFVPPLKQLRDEARERVNKRHKIRRRGIG
ncbi:coil containing protein [Vibrio phage 2.275.O._10N.286.54.E11]|nr:coil containing protein [Vibrio phage 2.275.O._10N.286.54.E11]